MRRWRVLDSLDSDSDQHYARVESMILSLQLSISSVRRANGCVDLETVQRIRAVAAGTLENVEAKLSRVSADSAQERRLAQVQKDLSLLLREPAPIEQLARAFRVG